jgi:hypothetical protein
MMPLLHVNSTHEEAWIVIANSETLPRHVHHNLTILIDVTISLHLLLQMKRKQ